MQGVALGQIPLVPLGLLELLHMQNLLIAMLLIFTALFQ